MEVSITNTLSPYFYPTFACLLSTYSSDGVRSYEGYQILRVEAKDIRSYETLTDMYFREEFEFLSRPSKVSPTDLLVPPSQLENIKAFFGLVGLNYTILYDNLQYALEFEKLNHVSTRQLGGGDMNWISYHRLETIHGWMDTMATQYPNLVSIETVGNSTEGRPLKVMKISTGGENKPAIWLDGGIHAREWISPATVTFIANELITQVTRTRNTRLVDAFDWYIDPVLNPDGYEYTFTSDRLWRKTRSGGTPIFGGLFGCCKGTDPNRNWDFQWGGKGTSKNQCSQTYHGISPASEPEVKYIQDFIMSKKDNLKLFVTFHSYSQLLLLPWGYDEIRTDDYEEMMVMGEKALVALKAVHNTEYKAGATPELLYPAAGGSHDWAKGVAGIKYSYCYELRDEGRYGFILPANQIIPTGQETFQGIKSMAEDVMAYYKLNNFRVKTENELFEINLERKDAVFRAGESPSVESNSTVDTNGVSGETFNECQCVLADQCFLPFVPQPNLKICTQGTVRCCKRTATCNCVQLIDCKSPDKPYGFCRGTADVNCCDMPPESYEN